MRLSSDAGAEERGASRRNAEEPSDGRAGGRRMGVHPNREEAASKVVPVVGGLIGGGADAAACAATGKAADAIFRP